MTSAEKKLLSERDICTKFITPALTAGNKWDLMSQIREEVSFTKGRVIVRGQLSTRGEAKRADYLLSYKPGIRLAVGEAKDNNHSVGSGMQQGLEYGEILDVPYVFSSNGDGFLFHDRSKKFVLFDDFLNTWSKAEQKRAIISELEQQGLPLDALQEIVGRDYDPFDLICHVAYDQPPLTRKERAQQVRKRNYFGRFGDKARAVMEALLDKYADQGIDAIESPDALKIVPFPLIGTPVEIIQ